MAADWNNSAKQGKNGLSVISASSVQPGDIWIVDQNGGGDFAGDSHMGVVVSTVSG